MGRYEVVLDRAKDVIDRSLLNPERNQLTGKWAVDKIEGSQIILKEPTVQGRARKNSFGKFNVHDVEWNKADFETVLQDVETQISTLRSFSARVNAALTNAVFKDVKETQVVAVKQRVISSIGAEKLYVNTMSMGTIGKEAELISEFLDNFVMDSPSFESLGPLVFHKPVVLDNLVATYLNGIQVNHIARLSHENVFRHNVVFNNLVFVEGSVISPTLGGKVLSKQLATIDSLEGKLSLSTSVSNYLRIIGIRFGFFLQPMQASHLLTG